MTEEPEKIVINPGYIVGQLAQAFKTSTENEDAQIRQRANIKIANWIKVFEGMLSGALSIGSRTPATAVPVWATLQVIKGGFATGEMSAGGSLQAHESMLFSQLADAYLGKERSALN